MTDFHLLAMPKPHDISLLRVERCHLNSRPDAQRRFRNRTGTADCQVMEQLAKIASEAAGHGIPFLVGGGHAVITHGFGRSTFDLDLIVRRSDREQWLQLAGDIGYVFYREGPTFVQFNAPSESSFPLDLMLVNEET